MRLALDVDKPIHPYFLNAVKVEISSAVHKNRIGLKCVRVHILLDFLG